MIKLFLSKVLKFIPPILLLMLILEVTLRTIPNDYSVKYSYLNNNANRLKTIVLGSSHSYHGIDPSKLPAPAYNAAMFSQSLDYDFRILMHFEDKFQNLENIVLPISYFSLFTNLETGIESWREHDYNIYYEFGEFYSLELTQRNGLQNLMYIYKHYVKDESYITVNELGWGGISETASEKELVESGLIASKRHTVSNFDMLDQQLKYLEEIINLAKKNHWNVYLITPPAHSSYVSQLSKDQLNKTLEVSRYFDDKFDFVHYKNYLIADFLNSDDFYDGDHLNKSGAEKFSHAVNVFLKTE